MWWLMPSSWHLVNCKNAEAHAWSSATLHLGQCEVPERIGSSTHELSSFCCCQKTCSSYIYFNGGLEIWSIFWKIRLYGASSEKSGCCIQCMCVGLEILARVLYFFLFARTWSHATSETVPLREECNCTSRHTFVQEQPQEETPGCHHSQQAFLIPSVVFFKLQMGCDF